ncbi:MAG TPA: LPS export ABC transporter ATP-binding protein [candidate division WOR-3 bacterium]|uniref:LPS export ABC transporter ATP-binding protein n=1 Tax=candidate division WOR-3 bacterium TaxID=2052148 RepID=A0A9C9JZA5_UNCW3|nr:LPS export ABC transporter ATP-binding protein [candidate division WOR-3 bacterium]
MLLTKELTKFFGRRLVVDRVNLEINEGEVVGLLGPNGAGKTTTFNMIVGLLRPNSGSIFLDELDITELPMYKRARRGISFLCQEPSVFRKLRVDENLIAIYEILGFDRRTAEEKTDELLKYFNLLQLKKQKAYTLSGGERRRVEIARALITNPKFLLLDEPFTGIDPISRAELQELILNLKKKGIGILISDHNVRETLEITDRAYLIYDAEVLLSGDAETLINDPKARRLYLGERFKI